MKKSTIIFFIAISFFLEKSIAQFNTVWFANYQHTNSTTFSNESRNVVSDPSGNTYVLADVTSNKDPLGVITASIWHYTVLSKYSPTGTLLISKSINIINHNVIGLDNKGAFGLKMDATGFLFIGYINYSTTTNFDVNIAKYNTSLVRLWNRKFNSTNIDLGIDLGITNGGEAYAIVRSVSGSGNITYHVIKAIGTANNDTVLYSFTANTDVLNAMTVKSGIIYATGYRSISGVKSIMTVKLNGAGSLKWTNINNGGLVAGDDFGKAIAVNPDGFVFVTGTSDQGPPTENDVFILKIQNSGATVWSKYRDFNLSPYDAGLFIEAIDTSHVYIGSAAHSHVLLDQVDANLGTAGGRASYKPIPVAPYQYLSAPKLSDFKVSSNYGFYLTGCAVAVDASNRTFNASYLVKFVFAGPLLRDAFRKDSEMPINGDFNSSRSGISMALNIFNNDVMWLEDAFATYDTHNSERITLSDINMVSPMRSQSDANATGINADAILITPNPSNSFISVSASEKISKLELFDITGKNVKTYTAASEMIKIDISDLIKGIYIGKIYLESGNMSTRKIIRN